MLPVMSSLFICLFIIVLWQICQGFASNWHCLQSKLHVATKDIENIHSLHVEHPPQPVV